MWIVQVKHYIQTIIDRQSNETNKIQANTEILIYFIVLGDTISAVRVLYW